MDQLAGRTGFLPEPIETRRVSGQAFGDQFDGDETAQAQVAGPIHLTHAACAQPSDNFVRSETRSVRNRHRYPRQVAISPAVSVEATGDRIWNVTSTVPIRSASPSASGVGDVTLWSPRNVPCLLPRSCSTARFTVTITCA